MLVTTQCGPLNARPATDTFPTDTDRSHHTTWCTVPQVGHTSPHDWCIQFELPFFFSPPPNPFLDGSVSESKRVAAMKEGLQDLEVAEEREKKKDIHTWLQLCATYN